jgi:hypothetical protein
MVNDTVLQYILMVIPDSADLTCVPRSREQAGAILDVILGHLETVHSLHMKTDLVLRVELPCRLAQFALKHTLVCPVRKQLHQF